MAAASERYTIITFQLIGILKRTKDQRNSGSPEWQGHASHVVIFIFLPLHPWKTLDTAVHLFARRPNIRFCGDSERHSPQNV